MAKSGALITSDVATEFFAHANWLDSMLDIFVERGQSSLNLKDSIMDVEVYDELGHDSNQIEDVT